MSTDTIAPVATITVGATEYPVPPQTLGIMRELKAKQRALLDSAGVFDRIDTQVSAIQSQLNAIGMEATDPDEAAVAAMAERIATLMADREEAGYEQLALRVDLVATRLGLDAAGAQTLADTLDIRELDHIEELLARPRMRTEEAMS